MTLVIEPIPHLSYVSTLPDIRPT